MHSKIYQIETSPVLPEDYITETDFSEHWFVGDIADYVDDDVNRSQEISYLLSWLKTHNVAHVDKTNQVLKILPEGKEAYFASRYVRFQRARDETIKLGLKEFSAYGEYAALMRQMNDAFCDKFGRYVSSGDNEIVPIDEFIRFATIGVPYYIGGVLDYHW